MQAEHAHQLAADALVELEAALIEGRSERLTAYLAAMSRFHTYSFSNLMLILLQRPDATRVAGFCTWKTLGRWVRKGETGIVIIAPMMGRRRDDDTDSDAKDGRPRLCGFRAVRVFDVSQTDGDDLPEIGRITGDPSVFTSRLEAIYGDLGIQLRVAEDLGGAMGVSMGGAVAILDTLAPAERFSTMVHELAHELMHRSGEPRPPRVVRETEAEAVAFVVSSAIGLEAASASTDYIQLYQGDAGTLAASMDRIQKTAGMIIARLLEAAVECGG